MSQQNKEVVKDGLLYAGLFLLLLASLNIPIIGLITIWFLPLPFLILKVKQRWIAFVPFLLVFGVLFWFIPMLLFACLISALIVGTVMGYLYRQETTSGTDVVLGGFVAGLIGSWGIIIAGQFEFGMMDLMEKSWQQVWLNMEQTFALEGIPTDMPVPPLNSFIPVLLISFLVPMVLLNYWIGNKWLGRTGFPGKYFPAFHNWRLPRIFFYAFLICFLSMLLFGDDKGNNTQALVLGIMWALSFLFIVQGISFVSFLLHHYRKSKAWLILLVPFALSPLSFVIQLLGMLDTGSRVREIMMAREKE